MIEESCKNCGMRIGSHSIMDSYKCGILSAEEAREIYRQIHPIFY